MEYAARRAHLAQHLGSRAGSLVPALPPLAAPKPRKCHPRPLRTLPCTAPSLGPVARQTTPSSSPAQPSSHAGAPGAPHEHRPGMRCACRPSLGGARRVVAVLQATGPWASNGAVRDPEAGSGSGDEGREWTKKVVWEDETGPGQGQGQGYSARDEGGGGAARASGGTQQHTWQQGQQGRKVDQGQAPKQEQKQWWKQWRQSLTGAMTGAMESVRGWMSPPSSSSSSPSSSSTRRPASSASDQRRSNQTPELKGLIADVRRLGLSGVLLGVLSLLHLHTHGRLSFQADQVMDTLSLVWFVFMVLDIALTATTWIAGAKAFSLLMATCPACGNVFYYSRDSFQGFMSCPACFAQMRWDGAGFVCDKPRFSRVNYGHDAFEEEPTEPQAPKPKLLPIVDVDAYVSDK